jgi:hypothetical protein
MTEDEAIAKLQAHIATPVKLSPEDRAALDLDRAMQNCYIDTCNEESLEAIMHNTGHETDLETIFEKLAKLTVVPIASGKSREPVVFMLDSLSALENMKCQKK